MFSEPMLLSLNLLPTKNKVAKKRVHPIEEKNKFVFKLSFVKNPPIISIYAYYDTNEFAFYYDKENPVNDYFYKALVVFKTQHLKTTNSEIKSYKSNFTTQGFKYKPTSTFIKYTDIHGNFLHENEFIGKKVSMKLRVKPYDFISPSNGNRLVGMSICVQEITRL
mgnify:CR=1 FL=1